MNELAEHSVMEQTIEEEGEGNGHIMSITEPPEEFKSPEENPSGTSSWQHTLHVTYNPQKARFEGLPDDWGHMNQQFAIPYKDVRLIN